MEVLAMRLDKGEVLETSFLEQEVLIASDTRQG